MCAAARDQAALQATSVASLASRRSSARRQSDGRASSGRSCSVKAGNASIGAMRRLMASGEKSASASPSAYAPPRRERVSSCPLRRRQPCAFLRLDSAGRESSARLRRQRKPTARLLGSSGERRRLFPVHLKAEAQIARAVLVCLGRLLKQPCKCRRQRVAVRA